MEIPPGWLTKTEAGKEGAFGKEPVPDANHLLAPIKYSPFIYDPVRENAIASGMESATHYAAFVERKDAPFAFLSEDWAFFWAIWGDARAKATLGFPKFWAWTRRPHGQTGSYWVPFHTTEPETRIAALALVWDLAAVLSGDAPESARELTRYVNEATRRAAPRHWTLTLPTPIEAAAQRAEKLIELKIRFSSSVEFRLISKQTPFFAQAVWRTAYAVGMKCFQENWPPFQTRFGWPANTKYAEPLFLISVSEAHGVLSPESAARNETIPGLSFYFELPTNPAPVETFDRMAIAVNYFAQTLNGRPVTATGRELDADTLEALRDELETTVQEMARLGLAPGSPEAARFF